MKKSYMIVCGLAKQLFVLIAFMTLFAMLMMFANKGAELSCHTLSIWDC